MNRNYLQEIQALRGIAIILVFFFHLNKDYFSYGYLGVDIFFVISGFVITKIIFEKSIKEIFSFRSFFVSRILRLMPALLIMVLITSFFILLTYKFQANPDTQINTGILSLVGLSNFYLLYLKNDYFNSFDQSVFEHTWSLSIEFQFYLIYPIFLFILFKFFKDKINLYIYSLTFILSIFLVYNTLHEHNLFYHTETRIWEFIVGCLTFFLYKKRVFSNYFIIIFSILPLGLFYFTQDIFYLIALVCFISSFIILSYDNFSSLKLILNNKILCYIGNVSYSLYLWHLPVIFFANTFFLGFDYYFFSILFSVILSMLSYYFIEIPFIKNHLISIFFINRIFTIKKIIFITLLMITSLMFIDRLNLKNEILTKQSNFYNRIANSLSLFDVNNINFDNDKDLTCHEKLDFTYLKENCFKSINSKKLTYFFGDSSMLDYYYSYGSTEFESDQFFSSYNNSSFWKPIFIGYPGSGEPHLNLIDKINFFSKNYEKVILVLSFNHKRNHDLDNKRDSYFINQQIKYLNFAKSLPKNIQIIFIKDTPYFKYGQRQCHILTQYSLSFLTDNIDKNKCDHSKKNISKKMKKIDNMFRKLNKLSNLNVVDIDDYFCEGAMCTFYKNIDLKKIAKKIDGTHLTTGVTKDITPYVNKKLNALINKR